MKTNGTGFTQRGEGGGRSFRGSSGYQEKWRGSVAAKSLCGMDGEGGGGGNQVNFIPLPPPLLAINNRQSGSSRQFNC